MDEKVDEPRWTSEQLCPVCQQGSSLVFLTCPKCCKVILACDEEGTAFPEPHDLTIQSDASCDVWVSTVTKCPGCQEVVAFRFSSSQEIQGMGFSPKDYS